MGPEVADSDSDHICVDDKGSGNPGNLAKKDPYENPATVVEMLPIKFFTH